MYDKGNSGRNNPGYRRKTVEFIRGHGVIWPWSIEWVFISLETVEVHIPGKNDMKNREAETQLRPGNNMLSNCCVVQEDKYSFFFSSASPLPLSPRSSSSSLMEGTDKTGKDI